MDDDVLGRAPGKARRRTALVEQGMLELYGVYCYPRRCIECPLMPAGALGEIPLRRNAAIGSV